MLRTTAKVSLELTPTVQKRTTHQQFTPLKALSEKLAGVKNDVGIKQQLIKIHEEQGLPALDWAKEQAQKSSQYEQSIYNQPVREAAHAYTIVQTLGSTIEVLDKYDFYLENAPLLSCLNPKHEQFLLDSFKTRFYDLEPSEKITLCAALEPGVLEKMGITSNPHLQAAVREHQSMVPLADYLNHSELISLIDYVNSSSGIFNAVNSASRAKVNYGEPLFQQVVEPLAAQVISSLQKLEKNPDFAVHDSVIFKGVSLSSPAGRFMRLFLDHCLTHKKPLAFPHVISGTSNQFKSYAESKHDSGYHDELTMTLRVGIKVSMFHDVYTKDEEEVIGLPNQKFYVAEQTKREFNHYGRASGINEYRLTPFSEE